MGPKPTCCTLSSSPSANTPTPHLQSVAHGAQAGSREAGKGGLLAGTERPCQPGHWALFAASTFPCSSLGDQLLPHVVASAQVTARSNGAPVNHC
jgi:hypothetical protein